MAFHELKAAQRQAWGAGSYDQIPDLYEPMLEHITRRLDPAAGERWLDLGTGTGALAERAAGAGAAVTGLDPAGAMVATARRRAGEAGLPINYEVGDAESVPHPDGCFDVVASNVGAVFTPDHAAAAAELARVCRPGGRLGFTAWRREPSMCGLFDVIARFEGPRPAGMASPFSWAEPDYVRGLLGAAFELDFEEGEAPMRMGSAEAAWDLYSTAHGPTRFLVEALDPPRRAELREAYIEFNRQFPEGDGICRPGPYVLVTGRRR